MSRAGVAEEFLLKVEVDVGGGDEVRGEFAGQGAVETGENLCGFRCLVSLAGESDLNHRSNEGGRKAVAGDVGDENADVLVVDLDEIVEVAGDGGHGGVAGSNFEAEELGNGVGKDGKLNLAGHFEFLVEGVELGRELGAGFAEHDVAADARFDNRGRERLVDIIDGANFEAVGFIFSASLASEENDGNLGGGGVRFEAGANFIAIDAGHHDVEEDQVGLFVGVGESQGLFAIGGDFGAIGILESARDDTNVGGGIVDDEDELLCGRCSLWCGCGRHSITPG